MDSCKQIENLRNNLIEVLNSSELTIGCAFYVLKDVLHMLENEYAKTLNHENYENNGVISQELKSDDLMEMVENNTFETIDLEEKEEE